MPKNRVFKILSIDGGGILGLYSADVLNSIQTEFLQGKSIIDEFHLITGTSTGGIIALALAIGRSPKEVSNFYTNFGAKIFPKWRRIIFPLGILHNTYSNSALKQSLTDFFGDLTISDCKIAVCIPAIDICNCQPIVFKTNNNGNQTRDTSTKLKDIALATSAAPSFFPIYSFGRYLGLVDGGLWQNNPALCGLVEAIDHFVGNEKEFTTIKILSVGNPLSGLRKSISIKTKSSSLIKWNSQLVLLPMKLSSIGTHYILNLLLRNKALPIEDYLRIESDQLTDEYKSLSLDSADDVSYRRILSRSQFDFNQNKQKLKEFFREEN